MKHISLAIALFVSIQVSAKDYYFTPKWKKGDKYEMTWVTHEKEIKKGKLVTDTTTENDLEMKVTMAENGKYRVRLTLKDVAFASALELYDKLDKEYNKSSDLNLKFKINAKTGDYKLTNRQEALGFVKKGFDDMTAVFENDSNMAGMGFLLESIYKPILKALDNDSSATAYYSEYLEPFIAPYWHEMALNDTLTIEDASASPFNPEKTIHSKEQFLLTSVDNKMASIEQFKKIDATEAKQMFKDVMKALMEAFIKDEEKLKQTMTLFDNMEMNFVDESKISFDVKNAMTTKYTHKKNVQVKDPLTKKENNKNVETSYIIKKLN